MFNSPNAKLRLAYWQDQFTVLSVRQLEIKQLRTEIFQVLLYCRGHHALAHLRQSQVPHDGIPRPGDTVAATLQVASRPGSWRLHVKAIEKM